MKSTRIFRFFPFLLIIGGIVIGLMDGFQEPIAYYMIGIGFFGLLYTFSTKSRAKFDEQYFDKEKEDDKH